MKKILYILFMLSVLLVLTHTTTAGMPKIEVTPEWTATVREAAPSRPAAVPQKERKVLLFSLTTGYDHWVIPHTKVMIKTLADKTGAFQVIESDDPEIFTPDNLVEFDTVIFNNNCSKGSGRDLFVDIFNDAGKSAALRQNIMDYVAAGRGYVGFHGACVAFNNCPKWDAMQGCSFDFHPKQQELTLNLVDPDHPLVKAFGGEPFVHVDEPYMFKNAAYEQKNFRPLLAMDASKLKLKEKQKERVLSDTRYVSWIKRHGKGRVFYCSPSHNAQSFEDPRLLQFILDGIQYALGDLECDDTPMK